MNIFFRYKRYIVTKIEYQLVKCIKTCNGFLKLLQGQKKRVPRHKAL